MRLAVLVVLAVLASAPAAALLAAQPVPTGPETLVLPDGGDPAVAAAPDGRFVILSRGAIARAFGPDGAPLSDAIALRPGNNEIGALSPDLAALAGGGYVAVWANLRIGGGPAGGSPPLVVGGQETISARILDAAGQPAGPEIALAGPAYLSVVAADPTGGFVAAWQALPTGTGPARIAARRYDAQGVPRGAEVTVAEQWTQFAIASLPDGGFAVAWEEDQDVLFRLFGPDGSPASGEIQGSGTDLPDHTAPRIGTDAAGRIVLAWHEANVAAHNGARLRARRFAPGGSPLGPEIPVHSVTAEEYLYTPDLAVRSDGSFLVTWGTDKDRKWDLLARAFAADDTPEGNPFPLQTNLGYQQEPDAAPMPDGWVLTWEQEGVKPYGVYVRRFLAGCGGPGLCLRDGRFRAEVTWHVPGTGQSGAGSPIPRTGDTGAFWFFSPSNYELLVKVLDGRGVNGHYWVFYGALTDVEFDLTVTDTQTGQQRTYHNPAGTMASRADTEAFPQ